MQHQLTTLALTSAKPFSRATRGSLLFTHQGDLPR